MFRLISLLLLLWSTVVGAEVYRWVTPDGTVHFSDQPHPGAQPVEIGPVQTYTPAHRLGAADGSSAGGPGGKAAPAAAYSSLSFVSPQNDQPVRANNGLVTVSLLLVPALDADAGHRLEVTFDGQPMGGSAPTSFQIPGVSRGSHTLEAAVLDADGATLIQAPGIVFHVLRATR